MNKETTSLQTSEEAEATRQRRLLSPPTDVLESADAFELRIDLPGADPKSIDVTLEQDVLTLRAETTPAEQPGFSRTFSEFEFANFERRFRVTEPVDADRIEANYKLGVLRVRVPKAAPARRRIEVEAS